MYLLCYVIISLSVFSLFYILRKNFNWKIVFGALCVTAVILIVCILFLNYLFQESFIAGGYLFQTMKSFERQKEDIQILFSGPSELQFAIIPSMFRFKAFNFSPNAEDMTESYYKLKYCINRMPKLKVVVLGTPLSIFSSLWHFYNKNKVFRRDIFYIYNYMKLKDVWEFGKFEGFWTVVKGEFFHIFPVLFRPNMAFLLEKWEVLVRYLYPDRVVLDGWSPAFGKGNITKEFARQRVRHHFEGYEVFDKTFLIYFEKILKLCHNHNIKVIVILCPVTDSYLQFASNYITRDIFYKKILKNPKYSKYIYKILDFLDLFAKHHEFFDDVNHLNINGAVVFSELVADELYDIIDEKDVYRNIDFCQFSDFTHLYFMTRNIYLGRQR